MNKKILFTLITLFSILSTKHMFAERQTMPVIKKTGKTNAKKVFSKDEYSLYKATYLGQASKVRKLLENKVNLNVQSPNSKKTPLGLAAEKGRTEILKMLVDGGANLELKNAEGKTPLYVAIKNSRTEIIKYLKSKGAKITKDMLEIASPNIKSILTCTNLTSVK